MGVQCLPALFHIPNCRIPNLAPSLGTDSLKLGVGVVADPGHVPGPHSLANSTNGTIASFFQLAWIQLQDPRDHSIPSNCYQQAGAVAQS